MKHNTYAPTFDPDARSARDVPPLRLVPEPPAPPRGALASMLERTAVALPCPEGVYDPRPGLPFQAECTGGARNSFYGAGNVNAFNVVR